MLILYDKRPIYVLHANELDLRRLLHRGDRITYGSYYTVAKYTTDTLPRATGIVVTVSRYHALVRLPSGNLDTANWYDITAIGTARGKLQAYKCLLQKTNMRKTGRSLKCHIVR